jgi:hypothetical protein
MIPLLLALLGCPGAGPADREVKNDVAVRGPKGAAAPAVAALRAGQFEEASARAAEVLSKDKSDAQAHLVRALVTYKQSAHNLSSDVRTLMDAAAAGELNHRLMRYSLEQFETALLAVQQDLRAAAADKDVSMELCLACWQVDWNHNGRLDDADAKLFQIEVDADGHALPADDPRRKPTFRFDRGDVTWARALVAFQRAALNVLLAYRWSDLGDNVRQLGDRLKQDHAMLTIHLQDAARVRKARELLLEGLRHADNCRREYLAETDDDREWVPNPRQKDHPMPLPADETLYQTWEGVVGDLERLVLGKDGLSVAEVAELGKRHPDTPPGGYINIGKLLDDPKDIVVNVAALDSAERNPERAIIDLFGSAYVQKMQPSPLLQRLLRMEGEIDRGQESFERKLRYLFWLN